MNPNEIQNNEPNRQQVINPFLSANTSFLQMAKKTNDRKGETSLANFIEEKREIIKDGNDTKIIEEKKYEINEESVPFNSLINQESQFNKMNTVSNINTNMNISNNNIDTNLNTFMDYKKNISNFNSNTLLNNSIASQEKNRTYKIELFRSQKKSGEKSLSQSPLNKVQIININQNKSENYKTLIKRIAIQLKVKIKPPTKGFFYNYLVTERQKKYKILVKRIAIQLRKRIKFPTAKIFKIYESYIILIKRIAHALNISRKKQIDNNNEININNNINIETNLNKDGKIIIDEENFPPKIVSSRSSKKSKKSKLKLTMIKKEDNYGENILKLSEDNTLINKSENNKNLNSSQDLNISLSNIEVTSCNFIQEFKKFLDKTNIQIINNFPVSSNEKNVLYFQQSNFWLFFLNYLFYQKKSISIYTIISLLEQYFIWCKDKNIESFNSIKQIMKEYIKNNYSEDEINQFLFMNKLKIIDSIFEKFEKSIKFSIIKDYKEIKLDDINLTNQCNCDLCKNDDACIKKVRELNKDKIKIIKSGNIDFIGIEGGHDIFEKNKNIEMGVGSGEEVYLRGISEKKNRIFTKSKTKFSENTKFQYNNITRVDSDDKEKTFKNISKKKLNPNEFKEKTEEIKNNEEVEKKEEKVIEEENKEENKEEENTKNKKKVKKNKKDKSRNKYKKKSKKEEEEDSEKEKDSEEEKEEKIKKKKKSRKLIKSENNSKDEDSKEKEEHKSRSKKKSRTKKTKNSDDEEDEESLNSSRKKSKTPRNKKSKK